MNFSTVNGGRITAYGHKVGVRIFDEFMRLEVFFAETHLDRSLLGRDLLEKMQIGLNESLSTLYLF
jgi:hypothetical protein